MAGWGLTQRAARDLDMIAAFTLETWGATQAAMYTKELERGFDLLASHPALGRSANSVRSGLRRFEHASHVIFFRVKDDRIVIARVLHERRLPLPRRF